MYLKDELCKNPPLPFCELYMCFKIERVPWKVWPVSKPETACTLLIPKKVNFIILHLNSCDCVSQISCI